MKKTHPITQLPNDLFATKDGQPRRYRVPTALEIEALESRVLLSGIGSGLNKHKVIFKDADGDKVKVFIKKGGNFDITLDGGVNDRADIASIVINGATENSRLVLRTNTQRKPGFFTPGLTNVGSIFADGSLLSISTTASILQSVEVTGNLGILNLGLTKGQYQAQVGDPSEAFDLGSVTIGGDLGNLTFLGRLDGENDLVGDINVAGDFGTLEARNSDLLGALMVGGRLDRAVLDNVVGPITADDFGTLIAQSIQNNITVLDTENTLNISATQVLEGVVIDTTGSLDITIGGTNEEDFFAGSAIADGDVTLFTETLRPTAVVDAGGDMDIRSNNIVGTLTADGAATLTGGGTGFNEFSGTVTAASVNDGGTIRINEANFTGVIIAVDGNIGNLLLTQENALFQGTLTASNSIGNLTGAGFDTFTAEAGNDIGIITAQSLGIDDSTFSAGDSIGAINSTASGTEGGAAIVDSVFTAANAISSVTARSVTGHAISNSDFLAGNFIGHVLGSSTAAGFSGIIDSLIDVDDEYENDADDFPGAPALIVGSAIATVTGEGSGAGNGIANTRIESEVGSIGNITGSSSGTGTGLLNVDITASAAAGSIGEIVGNSVNGDGMNDVVASAGTGGISLIRGTNSAVGAGADGIIASVFDTSGSIGSITGRSTSQHGISTSVFDAVTGIGNIIGTTSGVLTTSSGILNSTFRSGANIGTITGSTGISGATVTAIGGTAPTLTTTTVGPAGFDTSNIAVLQGNAGTIFSARGNIGSVTVANGNVDGAVFVAGLDIGDNRILNGSGGGDTLGTAATSIGSVSIANGRLQNTILAAGVNSTNNTFGDADDTLSFAGSSIGAISVLNTGHITNVVIESGTIGNMTVGGPIDHLNLVGFTTLANIGLTVNTSAAGVAAIQHTALRTPGSIGNISATNTSTSGGDGILNSIFWAGYLNATTENTVGNITGSTAGGSTMDADGLDDVNVVANGSIGNVSASVTNSSASANSGITDTNIIADHDNDGAGSIGTVTSTTAGRAAESDAIRTSLFRAGAGIGDVSTTTSHASGDDGIDTSTFQGNFDANGSGSLGNFKVTSNAAGDGIFGATLTGISVGNITVDPPGDDGIDSTTVTATAGSIGNVTVTGAGDDGIDSSTFTATVNIGNVTTNSTDNGIVGSTFTADSNGSDEVGTGGSIGNVGVTTLGLGGDSGIINSTFTAGSGMGNLTVNVTDSTGNHGITNSTFAVNGATTPTDGAIGNISSTTAGVGNAFNTVNVTAANIGTVTASSTGGSGIVFSNFTSNTNIGDISVTAAVNGITIANFTADSDNNDSGRIGDNAGNDITVTTSGTGAGTVGISNSNFTSGNGIGNVQVTNNGAGAQSGIDTVNFLANSGATPATGAMGNITSTTAGLGDGITNVNITGSSVGNISGSNTNALGDDGIENVTVISQTSVGNVSGNSVRDDAVGQMTITAGTSIGNITGTTTASTIDGTGLISVIATAGTSIGTITGTSGTGDGIASSDFTAGTTMGNISGTATSATAVETYGIVDSDFIAGGTMGTIVGTSAGTGTGGGILNSTFRTGGSITSITAGTGNATGNGIEASGFNARQNIGNITSTGSILESVFVSGINLGANFAVDTSGLIDNASTTAMGFDGGDATGTAPSTIGNVLVLDSDTTGAVNGLIRDTIVMAGITGAGADTFFGTLDDVTLAASTLGNLTAPQGIYSSAFGSGSIGNTLVTAGAIDLVDLLATNEAVSGTGIGTISATNTISAITGDAAISFSNFESDKAIGAITAVLNGTRDADPNAAMDSVFASAGLTLGALTATNNASGVGGASFGIQSSTFETGVRAGQVGGIGAVTSSITSTDGIDGISIFDSTFDTAVGAGSTGNIASVSSTNNGTDGSNLGIDASAFRANGNIGSISSIVSAASLLGVTGGTIFSASGNVGTISVQGSVLDSQFLAGFDIGSNFTVDLADVATAGKAVGSVAVQGTFQNSDLVASVDSGVDTVWGNEINADNAGGGSIGSISVGLPASATSLLLLDAPADNAITADTIFPVQFGGGATEYNPAPGFEGVPFLAIIDTNDNNVQDAGDIRLVVF